MLSIPTGAQSGLPMLIATTENVSLSERMKSWLRKGSADTNSFGVRA